MSVAVLALILAREVFSYFKDRDGKDKGGSPLNGDSKYWKGRIDRNQSKEACKDIREDCLSWRKEQGDTINRRLSKIEMKIDDLPDAIFKGAEERKRGK